MLDPEAYAKTKQMVDAFEKEGQSRFALFYSETDCDQIKSTIGLICAMHCLGHNNLIVCFKAPVRIRKNMHVIPFFFLFSFFFL